MKNKLNQLEKNKVDVESLKENHKEFIKSKKLMLKSQQRFKSKKHNVFTEEINKIPSSDKRIQSIDSIEMRMEQAKI